VADERNGGVVFDVDGTLLDTNYLHVAAWWEAFAERGHDVRGRAVIAGVITVLDPFPDVAERVVKAERVGRE
jgi:beta-phosphoglucomutase-like phosphatase (HAD superfamily)